MANLRASTAAFLLPLLSIAAACAGEPAAPVPADVTPALLPIDLSDRDEGVPALPPLPCLLSVDDQPMRWSGMAARYAISRERTLTNRGNRECQVAIVVEGDGFALRTDPVIEVAPGSSRTVEVVWSPKLAGAAVGTLRIDGGMNAWEIPLEGEAAASCLTLTPALLDFGTVTPVCMAFEADVVMENVCSYPVEPLSIRSDAEFLEDPNAAFFLRSRPALGPLAAGETRTIGLTYRPNDAGPDSDRLSVVEESRVMTSTELHGMGFHGETHTDVFSRVSEPRVDMLFVIDDSQAMAPWAAQLRPFAEDLITFHRREQLQVRWGVTTTSRTATDGCAGSGADGRLVPFDGSGPRWLESESDLPASAFADLLDVGTCSEAPNEGMAAADRALNRLASQFDDPAHPEADDGNWSFLHRERALRVVFVAASDDASGEAVDAWRDELLRIKRSWNENLLAIDAIVAPEGGCETAAAGTRYTELAATTNGVAASICDSAAWSNALQTLGSSSFGWAGRYYLTVNPADADRDGSVSEHLRVTVDGVDVPEIGAARHWSYDKAANAVDFEPSDIPAAGAQVAITYNVLCQN